MFLFFVFVTSFILLFVHSVALDDMGGTYVLFMKLSAHVVWNNHYVQKGLSLVRRQLFWSYVVEALAPLS